MFDDLDDIVEADIVYGLFSDGECPHCGEYLENLNIKTCSFCGGALEF